MNEPSTITDVQFITIWKVTYKPDNPPLWQGISNALPKIYYFDTQSNYDNFLEKNKDIIYWMKTTKTIAVKHGKNFYPLGDPYLISNS